MANQCPFETMALKLACLGPLPPIHLVHHEGMQTMVRSY